MNRATRPSVAVMTTQPIIPEPIGDTPRPRIVHDAMWMAYVFHGHSASDTAAQLNRELKVNETKGSIVSYAHRQAWGKAAINTLPVHAPIAHVPPPPQPIAPRAVHQVAAPKRPLTELAILPPERPAPAKRPAYVHEPKPKREPEVIDLSAFLPNAPPVFGPVRPEHLHHAHCKWPLGHPGTPGFRHCGDRRKPGEPYCPKHCSVAYPSGTRQPGKR